MDCLVFATSHLCPHYKAPLAKGTLSSDGRVMCPWHGACFRVQTGDIEDAPSFDSLESFNVGLLLRSCDPQTVSLTPRSLLLYVGICSIGKSIPVCN